MGARRERHRCRAVGDAARSCMLQEVAWGGVGVRLAQTCGRRSTRLAASGIRQAALGATLRLSDGRHRRWRHRGRRRTRRQARSRRQQDRPPSRPTTLAPVADCSRGACEPTALHACRHGHQRRQKSGSGQPAQQRAARARQIRWPGAYPPCTAVGPAPLRRHGVALQWCSTRTQARTARHRPPVDG